MAGEVAQTNNDALTAILQQLFVGTGKETTKTTSDPANTNALQQLMAVLTGSAGGAQGDFSKQAAIADSTGQVAKIVNDSLQAALPDISSLNTKSGLYNSSTTQQLVNDLLARTSLQGQQATQENIAKYAAIQQGNANVAAQAVNAGSNAIQTGNKQVTRQTGPVVNPLLSLGLGLGKTILNKTGVTDKIGKAIKDIFSPATSSAADTADAATAIGNSTANLGNFQSPSFGSNSPFSSVNFTGTPVAAGISGGNGLDSFVSSLNNGDGGINLSALLGSSGSDSIGSSFVQSLLGSSNDVAGAFSGASPSIFGTSVGGDVSSAAIDGIQSIVGGGIGDLFGATAGGGLAGSLAANVGGNGLFSGIDFLGGAGTGAVSSGISSALPFAGSALSAIQGNLGGAAGSAIGTVFGGPLGGIAGNFIGSNLGAVGDAVGSVVSGIGDAVGGVLGSVICTELARQGFITKELLAKDTAYAHSNLSATTMAGYHTWAIPVVRLMRKSSLLTRLIAPFGIKFCNHVAGNSNFIGALVLNIGTPVCFAIGKCVETIDKVTEYNHG